MARTPLRSRERRARLLLEPLEDRTAPALLGQQLFPVDNPWNQRISAAPVAANSAAILNNIISQYGDGRLHPDFGQNYGDDSDLYGIPYNVVHGNSTAKVQVIVDAYPGESDLLPAPVPASVVIEGDRQNGPRLGVDNRGDSHLLVYDVDNNVAYEFYRASRPSENADGQWHADAEVVWDMKTNAFRTLGWTSADAAGLSILAGLVRPDEGLPVSQGGQGVINHAIRVTLQNNIILDQFIYPASHTANPGNTNPAMQPPMGARFRLKADVDISTLHPQSRVIAQAMKDYGMIVADNGSNFFFSGASSSVNAANQQVLTWNDDDIQDSVHGLKSLRFSQFEVVDLTPRVTDLSVHTGARGTVVTVFGQNFSGAGGRLKVFFGPTPVSGITIVDDTRLVVAAPQGAGTVDERVQSGIYAANPENIKNPIFGYGSSALNAAGKFTYATAPANQPPTVASGAQAVLNPLTLKTATLSVLGSDDAGEANLTYTWAIVAKPLGATPPTFSQNGANAAKSVTANLYSAGAYQFVVTIRDTQGLSVSTTVNLSVSQRLTLIVVTPSMATVLIGNAVQFSALARDQFGAKLLVQPTFTWSLTGKGIHNAQTGKYRAPNQPGGPYYISASAGGVKGTAKITVVTTLTTTIAQAL